MKQNLITKIKFKYLLALGMTAAISLIGLFTLFYTISSQRTNAEVINISGRQRALLQRTALNSLRFVSNQLQPHTYTELLEERENLRKELLKDIDLMEKSHEQLINGNLTVNLPGSTQSQIKSVYYEAPIYLDTKIKTYIKQVRTLALLPDSQHSTYNTQLNYISLAASGDLVSSLETVVSRYQKESEDAISRLQFLSITVLCIIMLLLIFEALFIFKPMVDLIKEENKQLEEKNKILQDLSSNDGLTGIANRRYFNEFISQEWARLSHTSIPLSIIMIDIDYFKTYNDTYGHQAGDECLKKVASTLANALKHTGNLAARYGGEEFAVVLPDTSRNEAVFVAEKLRADIEEVRIPHVKSDISDHVTISLGVATVIPQYDSSPDELIKSADQALYNAKNSGRNQVKIYAMSR
ncbi:MAG: diguanylate cyclase [Clostridia bacterium]|nr:diguanylate cyclase [Clostridia bacterium]